MKSILLIISVLLAVNSMAQDAANVNLKVDSTHAISTADELDYMRSCLGKYYKVRQAGFIFTGLSVVVAGASVGIKEESNRNSALAVAGGSAVVGMIAYISAEKWLKKASIKPADSGIGLKFEF